MAMFVVVLFNLMFMCLLLLSLAGVYILAVSIFPPLGDKIDTLFQTLKDKLSGKERKK